MRHPSDTRTIYANPKFLESYSEWQPPEEGPTGKRPKRFDEINNYEDISLID